MKVIEGRMFTLPHFPKTRYMFGKTDGRTVDIVDCNDRTKRKYAHLIQHCEMRLRVGDWVHIPSFKFYMDKL